MQAEIKQGSNIEHQTFGNGKVQIVTEMHITIYFKDHGQKKFVKAMVMPNLKIVGKKK